MSGNNLVGIALYTFGLFIASLGAYGIAGNDGVLCVTGSFCMISVLAGFATQGGPKGGKN